MSEINRRKTAPAASPVRKPVKKPAAPPAARPVKAQAAPAKKTPSEKPYKKALLVLAAIAAFIGVGGSFLTRYLRRANRKLDVFRKTEAQKTVTDSILAAVGITLVICLLIALYPSLRMRWGNTLARFGAYEKAAAICVKAEKDGYKEAKILSLRHKIAKGLTEEKRYDEALNLLLLTPPSDKTTVSLTASARMGKAEALYSQKAYEEASRLFYLLKDTEKGNERYMDSVCAMAVSAYLFGNEEEAHRLIMSVENADGRIERVAMDVTDSREQTNALLAGSAFSRESLIQLENSMKAVLEAKETMRYGRVAAGNRHTVGLKADGTVVAAGDNFYGQTNVSGWTDIVSVAAGAWHTVGLKADGTVVAAGDNTQGQTNVSGWTDIIMIACTDADTIGLKKDGTVVTCGMHEFSDLGSWTGINLISAGTHSVGALYGQGTMLSSHASAQMSASLLLADLSVSGACAAGVMYDGTLVSTLENTPAWDNLIRVEVSPTAIYGITSEGAVKTHFFRASDNPGLNITSGAAEIASGGTHTVVLFEDGGVFAFGLNDCGQTNVSGWNLN